MEYQIGIKYDTELKDKVFIGSNSKDPWLDLGILIEALGTMMAINRKRRKQTHEEMFNYVRDYLLKVSIDYDKSLDSDSILNQL